MKKLALLAMAGVLTAAIGTAAMAANEPVTITKLTSAIKCDGKLDDWKAAGIKAIHVEGEDYAADAPDVDGSAFDFYVGHDGKMIYACYDVATPVVSFWQDLGNLWNQTGVEIWFGGDQIGAALDPDGVPGFAWKPEGGKDLAVITTDKGFILEASFSMAELNEAYGDLIGTTLAPGASFQFSFGVDITDSEGGTRTGQLYYPIDWVYNDPESFATATLAN